MTLAACLVLLVALGLAEWLATARARRAIPIRIHVNGTRGKSTVTRLIAGALREAGIPTVAKTTGTAARIILPNGSERPIVRRGPASIREQAWLLRRAARLGARAVVVECMAIRPELQLISERRMIDSTIGVITNVRLDHTEVMGRSIQEIAASLSNTTPANGPLVWFRQAMEATDGSTYEKCDPQRDRNSNYSRSHSHSQNVRTALEVTRHLGIADEVALNGMKKAQPDPGAATQGTFLLAGRDLAYLDATAANDPQSLDLIVEDLRLAGDAKRAATEGQSLVAEQDLGPAHICVYNHRRDRPARLAVFAEHSQVFRHSAAIIVTGDRPSLVLMKKVRGAGRPLTRGAGFPAFGHGRPWHAAAWPRRCSARRTRLNGGEQPCETGYAPPAQLPGTLERLVARHDLVATIVFCGNTKGFDVHRIAGDTAHNLGKPGVTRGTS